MNDIALFILASRSLHVAIVASLCFGLLFCTKNKANSMARHRPEGNCSVMKGSRMRCKEHGRFDSFRLSF